uniref:SGNH hydrolase-type esterase domain-containing protein n=1 Tax=Aegilops tauschii subsp. strangulata TaxID=200361 RepID=A0A453EEB4_AEGTS
SGVCARAIMMMRRQLSVCVLLLLLLAGQQAAAKKYAAIFNFGDSLVDAGNLVVDGIPEYLATAKLPYGMTYFGYPTGRCSDGRLVVDFIAQELGLPLLPPSKARNATFHHGANFAITGATALDTSYFVAKGLGKTVWNSGSLHTQIKWLQEMKPKICSSPEECRGLFRRSLFIVGEFGGNDYNSPLFAFRPLEEVHEFVGDVVNSIGEGIEVIKRACIHVSPRPPACRSIIKISLPAGALDDRSCRS